MERNNSELSLKTMLIGLAADHGGFELKEQLKATLRLAGYDISDYGANKLVSDDDYPDFVVPLSKAVAAGDVNRGVAICASGVGASIAANKIKGIRAALITDSFSAHQGVEDDNMNIMCLGGQITGYSLSLELVLTFLKADFRSEERFKRRLRKVELLEKK
jgi:ribose 5-phosphate isomerase B